MKVIWPNVVMWLFTLAAVVVYRNTDESVWWLSLLASIFVWLMIMVNYMVGYSRGKARKSDGYFVEAVPKS